MLLNLLEYHWVEDIDEALLLLGRAGVKTVAWPVERTCSAWTMTVSRPW